MQPEQPSFGLWYSFESKYALRLSRRKEISPFCSPLDGWRPECYSQASVAGHPCGKRKAARHSVDLTLTVPACLSTMFLGRDGFYSWTLSGSTSLSALHP